jgi:hypothetical protein
MDRTGKTMATVQLRDGSIAEIPDGLTPDAMENWATRAQAAYDNAKSTPVQPVSPAPSNPSPPNSSPSFWDKVVAFGNQTPTDLIKSIPSADDVFPRDQYPGVNAVRDWMRSNIQQSAPGNFAANVAADVATMPWDAPASILNPILHTAQNYGYGQNVADAPLLGPTLKAKVGVTPSTDPVYNTAETVAQAVATGGGSLLPRLVNAAWSVGKGELGSYLGGKLADWWGDPRLKELFETGGGVVGSQMPVSKVTTPVVSKVFGGPDAAEKFKSAQVVQDQTGADQSPVTAGQVGGPFIQTVERWLGKIPLTGTPIHSAQSDVQTQLDLAHRKAVETATGVPLSTDINAPGAALLNGINEHVASTMAAAKPQIDDIEKKLGTQNTSGPGGGAAMVDPRRLINELNGMKTRTDAAGNVHTIVAPEVAAQIDAEIAKINSARQPENPALGTDDANMKVPFEALRQMKTRLGASAFGPGTPSLDDLLDGRVYGAYSKAIQGFANQLDPQTGADYAKATGDYANAADLQRTFKKIVDGGANSQTLTTALQKGLTAPETIANYAQTPAWNPAAAATLGSLGRITPGGSFNADVFAKTWNGMTPEAKALYTQGSPDMIKTLDAVAHLGAGFDPTGGRKKPVTGQEAMFALLADRLYSSFGEKGAGAAAAASSPYFASAGLESAPFKKAMAGQQTPWNLNLPALLAVAQQQGRNQGY